MTCRIMLLYLFLVFFIYGSMGLYGLIFKNFGSGIIIFSGMLLVVASICLDGYILAVKRDKQKEGS